jgi:hypothetical protein
MGYFFSAPARTFLQALLDCRAVVLKLRKKPVYAMPQDRSVRCRPRSQGETMDIRTKWLTFYAEHLEQASTAIFSYVERMIVATLIISAGAHVSSNEPAIVLFGYLRHGLVGRGVELFGIILLALNFLDGFYKLSKLDWHAAYQIAMSLCYFVLSVRLVQLILAFRGE